MDKGTVDNVETNAEQSKDEEAAPYVRRTQYKYSVLFLKNNGLDAFASSSMYRII